MFELSIQKIDWQKAIQDLAVEVDQKVKLVLESVGAETIAYLQSKTDQLVPPARGSLAVRYAHPGGWADVKGNLARAYGWRVEEVADGWRLVLVNTDFRSVFLEGRHGMFVLSGVTDPGGPVEQALAEVIPKVAPGWIVHVVRRA